MPWIKVQDYLNTHRIAADIEPCVWLVLSSNEMSREEGMHLASQVMHATEREYPSQLSQCQFVSSHGVAS